MKIKVRLIDANDLKNLSCADQQTYKEAKRQKCEIAATPNVFYVDPKTDKLERKATGIPLDKETTANRAIIVQTTGVQWNKIYKATYIHLERYSLHYSSLYFVLDFFDLK